MAGAGVIWDSKHCCELQSTPCGVHLEIDFGHILHSHGNVGQVGHFDTSPANCNGEANPYILRDWIQSCVYHGTVAHHVTQLGQVYRCFNLDLDRVIRTDRFGHPSSRIYVRLRLSDNHVHQAWPA
jgi:hypothetical protein